MTPEEEFDYFDVVIHAVYWLGTMRAYETTFNRPEPAANDD